MQHLTPLKIETTNPSNYIEQKIRDELKSDNLDSEHNQIHNHWQKASRNDTIMFEDF